MPLIQLTAPAGSLTPEGRAGIQRTLATTLLRWEGAPDTAFFRSIAWSYLHELPPGALVTAEDDEPRYRVDVTVPQGALSQRRKEGLVRDLTDAVLTAAGLDASAAQRVWVLINEQPDGTWGGGGSIVRYEDLTNLATAERADA